MALAATVFVIILKNRKEKKGQGWGTLFSCKFILLRNLLFRISYCHLLRSKLNDHFVLLYYSLRDRASSTGLEVTLSFYKWTLLQNRIIGLLQTIGLCPFTFSPCVLPSPRNTSFFLPQIVCLLQCSDWSNLLSSDWCNIMLTEFLALCAICWIQITRS